MVAIDASQRLLDENLKVKNNAGTNTQQVTETENQPVSVFEAEDKKVDENVIAQNSVFAPQSETKLEEGDVAATAGKISIDEGDTNISAKFLSFLLRTGSTAKKVVQKATGIDYLKELLKKYFEMKKFDINGDGKIDESEKAAYDEYKLAKKFDINKDGKLDDFERAAMEAYKIAKAKNNGGNDKKSDLDNAKDDNTINVSGMGIQLAAKFEDEEAKKPLINEAA